MRTRARAQLDSDNPLFLLFFYIFFLLPTHQKVLDSGLEAAHVPYSYGFAIIALTIIVKLATYPLTKKQMASTIALQALQPQVKAIQARYQGRPPEEAQVEVARLYKEAGVNPLAGCLPTLVTLPVWIGLYRALSNVADEGLLKEGWFWIPSLAGPTSLAAQKAGAGTSWLFPLVDGAPPIGWPSATAYLILPVLLVVSQAVTQRLMSPPPAEGDSSAQSTQAILKFLPLMIGWFSLNVPAGLTLYWFTNNLLSTAQQAYLKASLNPAGAGAGAGAGGGGGGMGGMMGGGASSPSSFTNASGQQRGPVVQAEAVDAAPARPTGKRRRGGASGRRGGGGRGSARARASTPSQKEGVVVGRTPPPPPRFFRLSPLFSAETETRQCTFYHYPAPARPLSFWGAFAVGRASFCLGIRVCHSEHDHGGRFVVKGGKGESFFFFSSLSLGCTPGGVVSRGRRHTHTKKDPPTLSRPFHPSPTPRPGPERPAVGQAAGRAGREVPGAQGQGGGQKGGGPGGRRGDARAGRARAQGGGCGDGPVPAGRPQRGAVEGRVRRWGGVRREEEGERGFWGCPSPPPCRVFSVRLRLG